MAEQPYQYSAVALLLSQPLLPTLAIILFSLFSSPEEEWGIVPQGEAYHTPRAELARLFSFKVSLHK